MTDTLSIRDLTVSLAEGKQLARCAELAANRGDIIGVVGKSGSGKTTLLRSIAGALPDGSHTDGTIEVLGTDVLRLPPKELQLFRRRHIGFVGQDAGARLNPYMRVRGILAESGGRGIDLRTLLGEVGLPSTRDILRRRPGQLSGGQQRRVAIARAIARHPRLLLLDEPTAGLDMALREQLDALLRTLAQRDGTTIVLACHDLSLLDGLATALINLDPPRRPAPRPENQGPRDTGEHVVLSVANLSAWAGNNWKEPILREIDLQLCEAQALAVVGPSGSGKTTLARTIAGLHPSAQGRIRLGETSLPVRVQRRTREQRRRIQLIPQDPLSTLNPTRSVRTTLQRPLLLHRGSPRAEVDGEIRKLLADVRLPTELAERYPHELSGGQRQRVAIARALAAQPDVLLCDEITASLDHETADDIMNLLDKLREQRGLCMVIITHELRLAMQYTSTALVLDEGQVSATTDTQDAFVSPGSSPIRPASK